MDIIELVMKYIDKDVVASLAQKMGLTPEKIQKALGDILPLLLKSLTKNSSTEKGAESLAAALDKDHDGAVLRNVLQTIQEGGSSKDTGRATNGLGILKHLLGDKADFITKHLAQLNGIKASSTKELMSGVAPVLMGLLGKIKSEKGLNPMAIVDLLKGQSDRLKSGGTQLGLLGKFIDKDGDGNVMNDIQAFTKKNIGGGKLIRKMGRVFKRFRNKRKRRKGNRKK